MAQTADQSQVELYGYWKGASFTANQMIHIMDYGNFSVNKVEILDNNFNETFKEDNKYELDTSMFAMDSQRVINEQ